MSLTTALLVVIFFSVFAFWKHNAIIFMLLGGTSLMVGLYWYDVFTTPVGLSISLMLVAYHFACFGLAFACIFKREEE